MATLKIGSGETYTTIASALAVSGPTDILELQENITENVTIATDLAEFTAVNSSIVWSGTSNGSLLGISFGANTSFEIHDFQMSKSGGTGRLFALTAKDPATVITLTDLVFDRSSGASVDDIIWLNEMFASNTFIIESCWFGGSAVDYALTLGSANGSTNAVKMYNCIINAGQTAGIHSSNTTGNKVFDIYNCVINNCAIGARFSCGADVQNCIFTNNTDDVNVTNSGDVGDFSYCSFEEALAGEGTWGSNCLHSINSLVEYNDESTNDFTLRPNVGSVNTGNTLASVTRDYNGVSRPIDGSYDRGAYEKAIGTLLNSNVLWNKQGNDGQVDSSETGPNGVRTGTITYTSVKFDNGAYSSSTSNYISYNGTVLDPNQWIIEKYVKLDQNITNGATPAGADAYFSWDVNTSNFILIQHNGSGFTARCTVGGSNYDFVTTDANFDMTAGTVYHLMTCYNRGGIAGSANTFRVYLDGVLIDSSNIAVPVQTNRGSAGTIVTHAWSFNSGAAIVNELNGAIDNLKIYNDTSQVVIDAIIANRENEGFNGAVSSKARIRIN